MERDPAQAAAIIEELQPAGNGDPVTDVVRSTLEQVEELNRTDRPRLAYALALVLEQWVPGGLEPDLVFRLYHSIAGFALRANEIGRALEARTIAAGAAREAGLQAEFVVELTNLASTLRQAGEVGRAAAVYEDALAAIDSRVNSATRAAVLVNAATAYSDLGEHRRALVLAEEGLELLRGDPRQKPLLLVGTINAAGSLFALGDLTGAEVRTREALDLARAEGIRAQEGVALGHLGLIRFRHGDLSSVIELLETAAQIAEEEHDLWNAQHWWRDLGNACSRLGLSAEAIGYFGRALQLSERVGDRRSEALCLEGIGLNRLTSDLSEGLGWLEAALSAFVEVGDAVRALEVTLRITDTWSAKAAGLERDLEAYLEGAGALETAGLGIADAAALETASGWLVAAEELADRLETPPSVLARSRSNVHCLEGRPDLAVADLHQALSAERDPLEEIRLNQRLAFLHARQLGRHGDALRYFDVAIASYERTVTTADWSDLRVRLRDAFAPTYLGAMKSAIALEQQDAAFSYCERSKFAEGRRLWRERGRDVEVMPLVEVAQAVEVRPSTGLIELMPGADQTFVFLFAPGIKEEDRLMVLDGVDLISIGRSWWTQLQTTYQAAIESEDDAAAEAITQWRRELSASLEQVGEELLRPLAERLDGLGLDEVTFVSHSLLHCLPLHAAPLEGNDRWLDRYAISYAPTASIVSQLWSRSDPPPEGFVGIGDPLGDLPLARREAELAARWFHEPERLLVGQQATREPVTRALREAGWFHFAGHALQVLDDPSGTGLLLAPSAGTAQPDLLNLLTVNREVRLRPYATVILSACESGAVTPRLSDELNSLAGGFLAAGAGAVVATYWEVADTCAALLLDRFYAALRNGDQSLAAALRSAQLWLRDLSEEDAYARLDSMMPSAASHDEDARRDVLEEFGCRRSDHRPFADPSDWSAFFLTGYAPAPHVGEPALGAR